MEIFFFFFGMKVSSQVYIFLEASQCTGIGILAQIKPHYSHCRAILERIQFRQELLFMLTTPSFYSLGHSHHDMVVLCKTSQMSGVN